MLPRSVKIGAHVFQIKMALRRDLGEGIAGQVDNEKNIILVSKYASRSRKVEILLHECLHAMVDGRDFPNEEPIIVALGESLTQFFADNPVLIGKMLKELSATPKSL